MTKTCPDCHAEVLSTSQPDIIGILKSVHSALDDALGDTDISHVENDDELREEHPVQWAAQWLAHAIELISTSHPNRMGTTPEMQKMYDEFGGETVTDEMVEIAWAAIVGNDIAKTCFNASIIRADLKTGLTAALAATPAGLIRCTCPCSCDETPHDGKPCLIHDAATPAVGGGALGYATRLLEHFVAEHFPHNPDWKPLPDLIGVLTQIDNAITIARDYKARLAAQPASPLRGRDKALEPFLNFAKCIPDNVDDARGMAYAGFAVAMGTSASLSAGNFRDLLSASIPGLSLRGSMQDELLNAAQPLFDNITRMIQCLADANWRPSRAHIEGARNTMQQAAATLGRIAASPPEQPAPRSHFRDGISRGEPEHIVDHDDAPEQPAADKETKT